jgi:hypothetical protein
MGLRRQSVIRFEQAAEALDALDLGIIINNMLRLDDSGKPLKL